MGFRKYKNTISADLVHKVELFDLETGDPAMANGRRQFVVIKGQKSRAYQSAVEKEEAAKKRKNGGDVFTFKQNEAILARRLSGLIVGAYIDAGEDEPDIIEFDDISQVDKDERGILRERLRELFVEVTDLALAVHEEVLKNENFIPGQGQSLSDLLSKESGTAQHPKAESEAA